MNDLCRIRKHLGMTQEQFARAIGIGRSTISAHERGLLPVPRRTMMAALLLAVYVAWKPEDEPLPPKARRPFL